MTRRASVRCGLALGIVFLTAMAQASRAQDLQPRRWTHLPIDANFTGGGFAYTGAEISDAPAIQLEDVHANLSTWAVEQIRTFQLFDKSARVEIAQPYQQGRWTGKLAGVPSVADRAGWGDTIARFSVNLYGAPPLDREAFAAYRAGIKEETIVGAGLMVVFPTGEYMREKLINIGANRFGFRPQLGVVHNWDHWSAELTGEVWFFTDNSEFFGSNTLESAPFYTMQTHLIYTFRPGLWTGLSFGAGTGRRSTLNGIERDDRKEGAAFAASFGFPFSPDLGAKIAYVGTRKLSTTGIESDSVVFGISYFW